MANPPAPYAAAALRYSWLHVFARILAGKPALTSLTRNGWSANTSGRTGTATGITLALDRSRRLPDEAWKGQP